VAFLGRVEKPAVLPFGVVPEAVVPLPIELKLLLPVVPLHRTPFVLLGSFDVSK